MRAMFSSFFRFFSALFNGAAEYAEAFESTGKYVKKATDTYVSELEAENAQKLKAITQQD